MRRAHRPAPRLFRGFPPFLAALALGLLALGAAPAAERPAARPPGPPRVILLESRVDAGGVLGLRVVPGPRSPSGRALGIRYGEQLPHLFPEPGGAPGAYAALVGIPLAAAPGRAALTLEWEAGGARRAERIGFEIAAGRYGEESLRVDPRHVKPRPEDLERIRREAELLKRLYASGAPQPLWRGAFRRPVPGEVNGPFGTRRLFNGELLSRHTGVDFRAQTGDPIRAANAGVVRLAEELFFSGNAVVIDHGAGVFSSYSHLSAISVAVGQAVEKGQTIGLAGATGRATGPHLHWGIKLNSVSVDPLAFLGVAAAIAGGAD
jgi:murein DD-endopeptidase MepM/ murein hydrolase activator NlpD